MKICLISNLYPPYNRGGAEQVAKNTVDGLLSKGHQVVVITAKPFGKFLEEKSVENLKIYRFFPLNLFFYGNDYKYPIGVRFFWHILDTFNVHSYFVARAILKKEKPDIVHTHNLKGLGYLIPLAIRQLGFFHVHTLHDVQLVEPSGIILKGEEPAYPQKVFLRHLYEATCRFLFGSPNVVISPSKFLLDFYEKRNFFLKSRKVILPNPVIEIESNIERVVKKEGVFNFLYLGQIEEHKGVLFLIKTFQKFLASQNINCYLHVVGSGSKLEEAKKLADDSTQIIFHGKVDHYELPKIFAEADITVVSSLCYENSPTVIFESFSHGVPVLASGIEGVAELIKDGQNGITFEAGNEAALLTKLDWCLKNSSLISLMGQSARESVKDRGLAVYLDKLLNLCYNS